MMPCAQIVNSLHELEVRVESSHCPNRFCKRSEESCKCPWRSKATVAGAFVAGAAAVVILMYVYRLRYSLKDYFEDIHFDYMGKLLVFVCLVYLYFNINEFLVFQGKMLAGGS